MINIDASSVSTRGHRETLKLGEKLAKKRKIIVMSLVNLAANEQFVSQSEWAIKSHQKPVYRRKGLPPIRELTIDETRSLIRAKPKARNY